MHYFQLFILFISAMYVDNNNKFILITIMILQVIETNTFAHLYFSYIFIPSILPLRKKPAIGLKRKAINHYFVLLSFRLVSSLQQLILDLLHLYYRSFRLVSSLQQLILYLLHLYYRSFRLVSSLQQLILYLFTLFINPQQNIMIILVRTKVSLDLFILFPMRDKD